MFKEIVSQLAFSPVMVERLSAYAGILKRRQRISGWACVILAVLVAVQIIVVALPPHSAATDPAPATTYPSENFVSGLVDEAPAVTPSLLAQFEALAGDLPSLGDGVIISLYSVLLGASLLTYISLRQRSQEVRIIRTQLNTGGL